MMNIGLSTEPPSDMATNVLSNFSCLDELVQVIYQAIDVFTVFSNVSDSADEWIIHLSCEGRWWRGKWSSQNVLDIVGTTPSDFLLEQFAEKLAENFIQGQICVTDWDTAPKFTLGPGSKKPMHIPVQEMTAEEGALYAASVLKEIAIQAKSRQCRLRGVSSNPIPAAYSTALPPAAASSSTSPSSQSHPGSSTPHHREKASLKQPEVHQRIPKRVRDEGQSLKSPPPKLKQAGASLAHPNKKARRYQPVDLGSDSED